MATSVFFQNYKFHGEQRLHDDLIVEMIKMHGDDMYYIPRQYVNKDEVYGEDDLSQYNKNYLIEMYIKTYDGFEGDGSFVSKFGLEIRDSVTFTVSKRRFMEEIGDVEGFSRPREGDLIYFPINGRVFEVKFVDTKPFFYPFGDLYTYDISCELFEYSNEDFDTGIDEVDKIQYKSQDQYDWSILDASGNAIINVDGSPILTADYNPALIDTQDDSEDIQTEADQLLDFSVADPFSQGDKY